MSTLIKGRSVLLILTFAIGITAACSKSAKDEEGSVHVSVVGQKETDTSSVRPAKVHKAPPKSAPVTRTNPSKRLPAGHPPVAGHDHAGHNHAGHNHAGGTPHSAGHPGVKARKLPQGHPPVGQKKLVPQTPAGGPLPLLTKGPGSEAELTRINVAFSEGADRDAFNQAFRQVFTVQRRLRNPVAAIQALEALQPKYPKSSAVYRVLGYAAVDHGFQHKLAMQHYKKAIELDPEYGEVHYALAFMYVIGSEKAKGGAHYTKSLELGIQDNRNIGKRFYPDLVK